VQVFGRECHYDEMLAWFPQDCQTWGGQAALADPDTVKEILRGLETS
jgi:hypothetical protein